MGIRKADTSSAYLVAFFVYLFALVSTVGLFNLCIDPYGMFGMPRIDGINANKPDLVSHLRIGKAGMVRGLRPRSIILGSSRAEYGLDPQHPGWDSHPVYNLGIPGPNTYELLRYFQHAHNIQPLDRVVIGLDLFQFNAWRPNQEDFDEELLSGGSGGGGMTFGLAGRLMQTLLSVDMLASSILTLASQDKENVYLRDGSMDQQLLRREELRWGSRRRKFREQAIAAPEKYARKDAFLNEVTGVSAFDHFRSILETAHQDSIDLRLFISPPHAWSLESYAALRPWETREEWKRRLVEINKEVAAHFRAESFPLWDFSGYHTYSMEAIPPWDDNESAMQWYFEGFHYTQELGNLMLDRIFHHEDASRPIADDFGVLLTPANIDEHLLNIRAAQERYRESHQKEVLEIHGFIDGSRSIGRP